MIHETRRLDRFPQEPFECFDRLPVDSPWGPIQTRERIAPGLWFMSTASHGGAWLDPQLRGRVEALYPQCMQSDFYHGPAWWEEDCEIAWVMRTFPEFFHREFGEER